MKISNVITQEDSITMDVGGAPEDLHNFINALSTLNLEAVFISPLPKMYLDTMFGTLKISQKQDLSGFGGLESKRTEIKVVL